MSEFEHASTLFDRVAALIEPSADGPMLLRIGGESADDAYWNEQPPKTPDWLFEVDAQWLSQLTSLVRESRLRLILDLNLAIHAPSMAARFVHAAMTALPRNAVAALEIGNEPDLYPHEPRLAAERIAGTSPSTPPHWTRKYSPVRYREDYLTYARALAGAFPATPLAAPGTATRRTRWYKVLSPLGSLAPDWITLHLYPTSECWPPGSPMYPTIPALLSERASAGLAGTARAAVKYAGVHREQVRVSEFNSISCGGQPSVGESFATALWAPDALFQMVRAGVQGVSWHIRPGMPNTPFLIDRYGLEARPELYGLALFAEMLGPATRLLDAHVASASGLHLKVWAVHAGRTVRVLLINKGPRAARVQLRGEAMGSTASVRRLWAPSLASREHVTFGGQQIGRDARWHGHLLTSTERRRNGGYHYVLPGYSAALVSIRDT